MEPHMIAALPSTVKHFIQIGDHKQLRPVIFLPLLLVIFIMSNSPLDVRLQDRKIYKT